MICNTTLYQWMKLEGVKSVLLSEITARKIEFAMLLSPNGTILVNAQGNNRTGESIDPNGLVTRLIAHPTAGQIRTSKVRRGENQ